jgi:hypothetical protein
MSEELVLFTYHEKYLAQQQHLLYSEARRLWTLEAISCAKLMEFEQVSLLHQSTNSLS